MEKVRIEDLKEGMVLARTIYASDGRVLVKSNTELSPTLLNRLKEMGLPAAYVESAAEIKSNLLVSDITRVDLIRSYSQLEKGIRSGKKLDLLSGKKPLFALIDEINANRKNPLDEFPDIRLHDDYIYGHSVNVCVIAVKMGLKMGYNQLKLAELAIGALYHDIGMTKIPLAVLNKVSNLTPEETALIRTHTENGYEILKGNLEISSVSAHVAYQHHERYNGSGYPRGMSGNNIHEFARMVAVADVFDSLTTEKVYRPALSFSDAIAYIQKKAGTDFDPEIVAIFLKVIE